MTWDVVVRIVVAAALGAVVGTEREVAAQPAGLRTHFSVAVGASVFGIVSTLGFREFEQVRELTNVQLDVTRVASNVVVGIGFLGAGVIFRQGAQVRNLTTAASLWVTAAIGLAAGVGDAATATLATVMLVAGLVLLRPLRTALERFLVRPVCSVRIVLRPGVEPESVMADLGADTPAVHLQEVHLGRIDGSVLLEATLRAAPRHRCRETTDRIARRSDVYRLEVTAKA